MSGSLSKSSAAQAAGARSQVSNLVAGLIVVATLLFLAPCSSSSRNRCCPPS
ncbi:SulP family inorganic anion transporter [Oerskovia sp. M15]